MQGQPGRAARLFGAAEKLREILGVPLIALEAASDRYLAAVRASIDQVRFSDALAEGRAMTLEQAIEYAMAEDG